jgi:hypothetical protein
MVDPPGKGKSGEYLMQLWCRYLEQLAENEGDAERQIIVGSYHAAEIFGFLSLSLDRSQKHRDLILARLEHFRSSSLRASEFGDCLVTAAFTLYNHMNTLCHQFSAGHPQAESLIRRIDDQVHERVRETDQMERSASAMQAAFPLLSLMTLMLGGGTSAAALIRQVEERFGAASARAGNAAERLLNALYRLVEMMQLFVTLSDAGLKDQVSEIAVVFADDDRTRNLQLKLSNGFCRLFELGHLLATHLDDIIP